MKRKIVSIVVFLILGVSSWYLFIREYDYQISFQSNIAPQSIFYEVKKWNSWGENTKENVVITEEKLFENIKQKITDRDQSFILDWNLHRVNDSITKVVVGVISNQHTISNRLKILTGSSTLVKNVKNELVRFRDELFGFSKKFKVEINGETIMPGFEYAAASGISKRYEKAGEMIKKNDLLVSKINNNRKGDYPFVKVKSWDLNNDAIQFYFGFPIKAKNDSLQMDPDIYQDYMIPVKAVKATYFGNYKNSDQAWFAIMNYAKKRNIELVLEPLEMFYNNPMLGGDELQWKAEIFLPVKE